MRGNLTAPQWWNGDKSHPLWQRLQFAVPGWTFDDVASGLRPTLAGSFGTTLGQYGLALNQGGTNSYASYLPIDATVWSRSTGLLAGPVTVMAVHTPTATTQTALMAYANGSSWQTVFSLIYSPGSNSIYTFYNDDGTNGVANPATSPLNQPHVVIGRRRTQQTATPTLDLWVDGAQVASGATPENSANSNTGTTSMACINRWGGFAGYYGSGTVHAVYVWARALADRDLVELSNDPWVMFRRPTMRSFSAWTGPADAAAAGQPAMKRLGGVPFMSQNKGVW